MLIGRRLEVGCKAAIVAIAVFAAGCGNGSVSVKVTACNTAPSGTSRNVVVSWLPNRETAVNRAGGGYRVYCSIVPGVALSGATEILVPYVLGPQAPTSTTVSLTPGTYYFRVLAYSNLNPTGSAVSTELQVIVPN